MKYLPNILIIWLCSWAAWAGAQTPYDSFAPEMSRPILDKDSVDAWRKEQQAQRQQEILARLQQEPLFVAFDMPQQMCYLLDTVMQVLAYTPIPEDVQRWLSVDPLVDKNISTSPYLYCNGNPIMLVDPNGMDWYYSLDENAERVYTYNENVFSQEDMDAMKIDGTYAGITTSYNNTYYGLFGYEYTDNNDKIFARRMDKFLIGEAKCSQSGENYHMSFVIPGLKNGQSMEFNYAGGLVLYSQVEKNMLHLEDWGDDWSNYKDFMTDKGFSGYVIRLENNKGYDPINIIYKDKSKHEHIYDLFVKTLFRRTSF